MLYYPYRTETQLDDLILAVESNAVDIKDQEEKRAVLEESYETLKTKIITVKRQVMEHLESTEEARLAVEESCQNIEVGGKTV